MKTYKVEITETLQTTVEVQADSWVDAEQTVKDGWMNELYVLGAENFTDVSFRAVSRRQTLEPVR